MYTYMEHYILYIFTYVYYTMYIFALIQTHIHVECYSDKKIKILQFAAMILEDIGLS